MASNYGHGSSACGHFFVPGGLWYKVSPPCGEQRNTGNGDLKAKQDTFNLIPLARTNEADKSVVRNDKTSQGHAHDLKLNKTKQNTPPRKQQQQQQQTWAWRGKRLEVDVMRSLGLVSIE